MNVIKEKLRIRIGGHHEARYGRTGGLVGIVVGSIGAGVLSPCLAEYFKAFAEEKIQDYGFWVYIKEMVKYATPIMTQTAIVLGSYGLFFDIFRRKGKRLDKREESEVRERKQNETAAVFAGRGEKQEGHCTTPRAYFLRGGCLR